MTIHRPGEWDGTAPRRAGRAARWGAFAIGLAALGAGCAAPPPEVHPVWPPPPAEPRIRHLHTIRDSADFGKPDFFEAIANAITGRRMPRLIRPHGVAVAEDRRLCVTDQERQCLLIFEMASSKAVVIDRVGTRRLVSPIGVVSCGGHVVISDSALPGVFVLAGDGRLERTIDRPGGFKRPTGLAYNPKTGLLYVVDTLAHQVFVMDFASGRLVRQFGEQGTLPGQFNYPTHVFVDAAGRVYVTDSLNFRVQVFDERGEYLFQFGRHGDATGHLACPKGVAVDSFGHIYIVDSNLDAVQIFDQKGRFLLAFGEAGTAPGCFEIPAGITIDSRNRIYVCDSFNKRIQIFQYVGGPENDSNVPQP